MGDIENETISKDFLIPTEALSRITGLPIVYADTPVHCAAEEAAGATCETYPGNGPVSVKEETKDVVMRSKSPEGKYDELIKARAPIEPRNLPDISFAIENNPLQWPKTAVLRFLHLMTHDRPDAELTYLYLSMVSMKMKYVCTNEPFNSPSYIHAKDLERYWSWKKAGGKKDGERQTFHTNFDVDTSIPNLKQMIWYFFQKDQMQIDMDNLQLGVYKDTEKPPTPGTRQSTRQRKKTVR